MITTYDAKKVSVIVKGGYLTGFAEGTFVTWAKDEENYSVSVGAKGDVARSKINNPLGTITITLQQTSPWVKHLNYYAKTGAIIPVSVIDKGTSAVKVGGKSCYVKKPADGERGDEAGNAEFEIQVMDYTVD